MKRRHVILVFVLFFGIGLSPFVYGESQENEYKGITDPFGDPANYEFAEDEKEDKEFFHLGRFLMFGVDFGAGIFTGSLGKSAGAGFISGVRLVYFFDQHIGFEAAGHYALHNDVLRPNQNSFANIDTQLIPLTGSAWLGGSSCDCELRTMVLRVSRESSIITVSPRFLWIDSFSG